MEEEQIDSQFQFFYDNVIDDRVIKRRGSP